MPKSSLNQWWGFFVHKHSPLLPAPLHYSYVVSLKMRVCSFVILGQNHLCIEMTGVFCKLRILTRSLVVEFALIYSHLHSNKVDSNVTLHILSLSLPPKELMLMLFCFVLFYNSFTFCLCLCLLGLNPRNTLSDNPFFAIILLNTSFSDKHSPASVHFFILSPFCSTTQD